MKEWVVAKNIGGYWISESENALTMAAWNDEPTRTVDEVIAAFDKAIALAEGQHS